MKRILPAIAIVLAIGAPLSAVRAQTNDVHAASPVANGNGGATPSNSTDTTNRSASEKTTNAQKPSVSTTAAAVTLAPSTEGDNNHGATTDAPAKTVTTMPVAPPAADLPKTQKPATNTASVAPLLLTNIYRVGVGDVLDIRLLNANTSESTLFTVLEGGLLEYPLAGDPLQIAGLTTDEISARITSKVKIYEKPQVVVSVREYGSHNVIVTGLVNDPGTKRLRREAVPLYVVLAEAQPRTEAGRATVMRAGSPGITVDLADSTATAALVYPGDVITLAIAPPKPPQFYFIGGQINSPGQKDFHSGLTLTQAILASGGSSRFAGNKVKVSRQGPDGRLLTTEYNLKMIESGKDPDPLLQPGDRVEIRAGRW
ncbi:MAG: polysaccharide biosynthesis/export family protein [Acidobacteria bacterium]|nr:polysaccharide biosynthesis/export family protein [Acidobacteriota bacterium]